MSDSQWYYSEGDEQQGPVSTPELRERIDAGRISPDDLVWCDGMEDWQPAGSLSALRPAASAPDAGADKKSVEWYYAQDDEQQGPFALAELLQLRGSGKVRDDDLVWHNGLADWLPASDVDELKVAPPAAAAAPAAPPAKVKIPRPAKRAETTPTTRERLGERVAKAAATPEPPPPPIEAPPAPAAKNSRPARVKDKEQAKEKDSAKEPDAPPPVIGPPSESPAAADAEAEAPEGDDVQRVRVRRRSQPAQEETAEPETESPADPAATTEEEQPAEEPRARRRRSSPREDDDEPGRIAPLVQLFLWASCFSVVAVGCINFVVVWLRSDDHAAKTSTGIAFLALFAAAFILAWSGDRVAEVLARRRGGR